jgi:hypothetical protein
MNVYVGVWRDSGVGILMRGPQQHPACRCERGRAGDLLSSSCSLLDGEKWICSGLRTLQSLFESGCQSVEKAIMGNYLDSYIKSYRNGPHLLVVTVQTYYP